MASIRTLLGVAALTTLLAAGLPGCGGLFKLARKGSTKASQKVSRGGCLGLGARGGAKGWHLAEEATRGAVRVSDEGKGLRFTLHRPGGTVESVEDLGQLPVDETFDIFLDTPLLERLADIEPTTTQRLWWLGRDGVARAVRMGSDGAAHVAAATTRDGRPRMWVRATEDLVDRLLTLSEEPAWFDEIVVIDPQCTEVPGARVARDTADALAGTEGLLLLVSAGDLAPTTVELARIEGLDLLALASLPVCGPEGAVEPPAAELLRDAGQARTWGEVWSVGATSTRPVVVTDVTQRGDWLAIHSPSRAASVMVAEPSVPPILWVALAGGLGGLMLALPLVWWRQRR